jgi:hypothetical protein
MRLPSRTHLISWAQAPLKLGRAARVARPASRSVSGVASANKGCGVIDRGNVRSEVVDEARTASTMSSYRRSVAVSCNVSS